MGECTLCTSAPMWISCMQANVATSESPSCQRRSVCKCSQPYHPVWCQSIHNLNWNARAVPTEQALSASFLSIRSVARKGGQFTAGPRLHTKSKGTKDAGRSCSDMRTTSIGTYVSIEDIVADVSADGGHEVLRHGLTVSSRQAQGTTYLRWLRR